MLGVHLVIPALEFIPKEIFSAWKANWAPLSPANWPIY